LAQPAALYNKLLAKIHEVAAGTGGLKARSSHYLEIIPLWIPRIMPGSYDP